MESIKYVVVFTIGCIVALVLQVYFYSPITPHLLLLPTQSSLTHAHLPPNTYLQELTKIGEGLIQDPEDVCVDKEGILYTATRDGWIKRIHHNGTVENWKWVENSSMLGLAPLSAGGIVVCDTEQGLLKVTEDGISTIASQFNGSPIKFADEVIEGKDGSLYFTIPSTKFGYKTWFLDVYEAKPYGQLLKYDSGTKEVSLVLDNLAFANGVALSKDEDYLLVCETWKFRCIKYWLTGDLKGKTEVYVENLPGAPDNIYLAPDGSYWIALLQLTAKEFNFVHTSKIAKHIIATFPKLVEKMQSYNNHVMVVKVSEDGKLLAKYDDPTGKVNRFVTTAMEYEGNLYLGSLHANFIGKLPLPKEA